MWQRMDFFSPVTDHNGSIVEKLFELARAVETVDKVRRLWLFMFFSKRAFNTPSCSSRCFGDNFRLMFMLLLKRSANRVYFGASALFYGEVHGQRR